MTTEEESEGGRARQSHVSVAPSASAREADRRYYDDKRKFDGYLPTNPFMRTFVESWWRNTKALSDRQIARSFRQLSDALAQKFGHEPAEIQTICNDKLWTHNEDGTLNRVNSNDICPLFKPGKQADWPNLVLTSNHARAGKSEDLSDLMKGVEQLANDSWQKPLDLCRLEHGKKPLKLKGKTIIALACHTERDIYLNGAELIDRRLDLEEDKIGAADPSQRTLAHISPAAVRLAKLIMKLMVEPEPDALDGTKLVDLDRSKREFSSAPFIADDHRRPLVMRNDAAAIAQHIKLVGYSRGANTVTDALRFLHREYVALGDRLTIRGKDGQIRAMTDADMNLVIRNIGLLSIAPGEVPLTAAEKHKVGINRVTILNTHDLTAGHLVKPDEKMYDRWSDRLVQIEGTTTESGHSIVDALGKDGQPGFIMDPANARLPDYETAQDEVKAFFASNHRVNAINTLCFSAESADNALYVQFAPGVTRGEVRQVEDKLLASLRTRGFVKATAQSDLDQRRRVRIVLNHTAGKNPIVSYGNQGTLMNVDTDAVSRCRDAFDALKRSQDSSLFVTADVAHYLSDLLQKARNLPGCSLTGWWADKNKEHGSRTYP